MAGVLLCASSQFLARKKCQGERPYARNPHFTERDELLDQLMQHLAPPASGQLTAIPRAALTQAQVIKGLGGIGKTQIAVEYAYRALEQGRYTHTLWITAASEEAILMSFAALADHLPAFASKEETDQRKLAAAVLRWLEQCPQPWLLIFDNADDLSLVQPYLPLQGNGSVLLTTRASAVGWLASSLEVDAMGMMEGIDLLRLCAFLAPDHIPEELFTQGAAHWPALLQQAVADRFRYNQMLETLLAFSLVKRLAEDRQLSIHRLVQVVQREQMAPQEQRQWAERLVRAVQAAFPRDPQEVASWQECQRYLEQVQACDLLIQEQQLLLPEAAEVLERTGTYFRERALYSLAEPLSRRALHIWEQQGKPDPVSRARSLSNLALLSYWQDKPAQTEALYQQTLAMREQQLGSEHLDVAESLNGLAGLYRMQGKYTEAEPLYVWALRIVEQQLGPEHLETANVLHDFAGFQHVQDQTLEAAFLYLRALTIRETAPGPSYPRTTDTRERLQAVLGVLSRTQEATQEEEERYGVLLSSTMR